MRCGTIEVGLHLELVEPIRGYLRDADGRTRAFAGWLEFNSAMQHLIEAEGNKQSGDDIQRGEMAD
jgi:hypothetical protein